MTPNHYAQTFSILPTLPLGLGGKRNRHRAPPHSVSGGTPQAAARSPAGAPSAVHSSPMDLYVGALLPHAPRSWGLDGGPSSLRPGPHHPPPPPLIRIRSQGEVGFQAGLTDTRKGYGASVSQPSWADQVEYRDMLDMANYQLVESGRQPNYLPPPWVKRRARPKCRALGERGTGRVQPLFIRPLLL